MIKKYPWYFPFLIFVILCLANIFQKLQWDMPTDNIVWASGAEGLVCTQSPPGSPIRPGDILSTVNKFIVKNKIDLHRAIGDKKFSRYEIERDGEFRNAVVDISTRYTPLTYYILAFSGILMLILALRFLNISLKKKKGFNPPPLYYLLAISFSGFLIFSPTGAYGIPDFLFLILDTVTFLFFPAFLLHYSLYYPFRSRLLRKVKPKLLKVLIYLVPASILVVNVIILIKRMTQENPAKLIAAINDFRTLSVRYFALYLLFALALFTISNLTLIIYKKRKSFILPLSGLVIGITSLLVFNFLWVAPETYLNLGLLLVVFLPVSLTYFLGHRKFTDIENLIKKTVAVSFIFPFIFGLYFFLETNIEKNKLLGLFWTLTAIITAGLLYKPIEDTLHNYFEKLFFRGAFNFKRKLKTLIASLPTERDLFSLSTNFLDTINRGFQLEKSIFIIHRKKNMFFSLPQKEKVLLSNKFRTDLFRSNHLVLYSGADFQKRYPKDYEVMKTLGYSQFLPLKTSDRLIGVVAIGAKKDGTFLSVEDWELLHNIASPLSLSVENASLYSELKTQFHEINLLKEFNENIIENINLGIVVLTGLNIVKTWNNIMEEKFQLTAEKAINRKAYTVFGSELWKRLYNHKKDLTPIDNVTVEIGGEELIFSIYMSPLRDSTGKRIGTILAFEDITEKVFIQNQLITSEKMASLGLLSAGIAHEVNTPLTGISSYCQLILAEPDDPENIELIRKVQEQVVRANRIIRSLLDFSRQKGEQPVELDMNKVINESIELVRHKFKQKDIQLKTGFRFTQKLYGFSTRLQQMFINLLVNAADAIDSPDGVISITGMESDTHLTIRIKDNGKGILQEYLDKIFDPFFTTKAQGKGTGLGLSIVYTIIEEHYGEITANSKVDKGSTFTISFPLVCPLRSIKL